MTNRDTSSLAPFWRRQAGRLAFKLNFHHWLTRFIPKLFFVLAALAVFELFRRETAGPVRWSEGLLVLGPVLVAGWAWLQARKHFCSERQALARIETVLDLHNRLSAAEAGVVPWPAPRENKGDGYRWNWTAVLTPLLAGMIFLLAAHLIPVKHMKPAAGAEPISQPPEFAQMQNWLDTLKAQDLIEPAKLQEMQAALDKLRDRPAADWYTQSHLEAANSLKELMEQSMNSLAQDLDQADQDVQAMQQKSGSQNDAGSLQAMHDELRQAGENLASGSLPLKRELVDQLRGGESAGDKPLSAQQLQELHDRLKKGELAAQTASKSGTKLSQEMQQAMENAANGQGAERRMIAPGPGGLGGGKQTAPLELQARDKTTPDGARTPVSNEDMSHAALGETLKVTAGEHAVDPASYQGTQNAGAAQVQGAGGEAVWRSTYDPQEADALSRFFK